nr:MAG TPA: hypothetical protein [Caudoviricetes sp.]
MISGPKSVKTQRARLIEISIEAQVLIQIFSQECNLNW